VTVTVLPVVLDNLRYDGPALIEIEDGANINLDDDCMLTCWFRTLWPEGVLLSKRAEGGGPGIVVDIRGGYVVTTLVDQDGTVHVVNLDGVRVDDGQWWFWGLNLMPYVSGAEYNVEVQVAGDVDSGQDGTRARQRQSNIDLSNDAPLRLGRYRERVFYGAVDYVGNAATHAAMFGLAGPLLEHRTGDVNMFSPTWHRRWLMDEGEGETITDAVGGATGSLSNHNRINWSTPDAALDSRGRQRSRLRGVEGNTMIPDFRKRN